MKVQAGWLAGSEVQIGVARQQGYTVLSLLHSLRRQQCPPSIVVAVWSSVGRSAVYSLQAPTSQR